MRNEVLSAILDELRLAGVKPTVTSGSKHWQVWWAGPDGQPRIVGAAVTPSDRRAPYQARAEVRRILRGDGMLNEPEARPAPREAQPIEKLEHRIARTKRILAQRVTLQCPRSDRRSGS